MPGTESRNNPRIRIVDTTRSTELGWDVTVAVSPWDRTKGLLGRRNLNPGAGLLLQPCSGIHTWGMHFPIDVIALDGKCRVIGLWKRLGSFRIAAVSWRTKAVVELPSGVIEQCGVSVGDQLQMLGTGVIVPSRGRV